MILGLLTLAVLVVAATVIIREFHHLLYVRGIRHMHTISELEARKNAAPLSSAVIHHRLPGDNE